MRAALLHDFKQPLALEDVAVPTPSADEVLIKIEACGVCHSDLSIAEGEWPQLKRLIKKPLIPGHEVVGRVVEKGNDVHHLQVGDRVGVAWLHWACGECELCKEGLENLCPKQAITGGSVDGGYAEFIKAKASHALKVPPNLAPEEAAPLFCAGITVYRAVKHANLQPGQRLAVFGIGGLGHLAIQIAKSFGAQVIAVDIADDKLKLATQLGADQTINATSQHGRGPRSHRRRLFQNRLQPGLFRGTLRRNAGSRRLAIGRSFFPGHHDARNQDKIGRHRHPRGHARSAGPGCQRKDSLPDPNLPPRRRESGLRSDAQGADYWKDCYKNLKRKATPTDKDQENTHLKLKLT